MVLAPLGIKSTQFVILRILAGQGAVPQWRLAQENAVAVETLSRRLAALRRKGLVAMEVCGPRGEHVYRLTEKGRQALDEAIPYWNRADERLRQVLGDEHLDELVAFVGQLAGAAQDAMSLKTSNRVHIAKSSI
jgi:DNA-binding MarR family transcriptional regulator